MARETSVRPSTEFDAVDDLREPKSPLYKFDMEYDDRIESRVFLRVLVHERRHGALRGHMHVFPFVRLGARGRIRTEFVDLKRLPWQPRRLAGCSSHFQCRNRLDLLSELLLGAFKVVPLLQIEPQIGAVSAQLPEP